MKRKTTSKKISKRRSNTLNKRRSNSLPKLKGKKGKIYKPRSISKRRSSIRKSLPKKHIKKGGGKNCSLGFAMVPGIEIDGIRGMTNNIDFPDEYARLNNNDCQPIGDSHETHPKIRT